MNISDLKTDQNNFNKHTEIGTKLLEKSLRKFGGARSIVIDKNNNVVAGNGTVETAMSIGLTNVRVIETDGTEIIAVKRTDFDLENDIKTKEYALADNQVAVKNIMIDSEMVIEDLGEEIAEDWVVEQPETVELEAQEDDFDTTPPTEPKTVPGDLYEIGEHRLLCGDSTDSDQVAKLMNGYKADMAHNDPPYGMKKEKDGVLNDNLNFDDLLQFNHDWIALQFTHLKENGSWYCWGIDEPLMDIYSEILKPYIKQQKATFRNLITWDKGNGQGQNSENTRSYAIADEKCLFVMCGVQGFNNNADNYFEGWENIRTYLEGEAKKIGLTNQKLKEITGVGMYGHWFTKSQWTLIPEEHYKKLQDYFKKEYDVFKKEYDVFKKEYEELKKEYYSTRAYFNNVHDNFNNIWKFDRHKRQGDEGGHATPKPIPLCERAIKSSCPDGGLVLDFFLGSGSTMVASHQLKRKCYGMELDPKYCDVIVKRMLKLEKTLTIKKEWQRRNERMA